MPDFYYFALPPFLVANFALMVWEFPRAIELAEYSPSPAVLAVGTFGFVGFLLPILAALARGLCSSIVRRRMPPDFADARWYLSLYRLPESLAAAHPWFGRMYYGSLAGASTPRGSDRTTAPCGAQ